MRISDTVQHTVRSRFMVANIIVLTLFSLLLVRTWYLQIYQGRRFTAFSEANRISIRKIPAMRGRILDRNGEVIADSRASFDLTILPSRLRDNRTEVLDELSEVLEWNEKEREGISKRLSKGSPHDHVVIQRDISRDRVARFLARQHQFPGVSVVHSPARSYPFGKHGSHMLGYLGEINKRELKGLKAGGDRFYQLGDVWGISGIEKTYEEILRGIPGARPYVEDAWGREIGEEASRDLLPAFRHRDAVPGKDLVLSLDAKLQEVAEKVFVKEAGAIVALDPRNGDVLVLISRPEFDPSEFVRGVSSEYWRGLLRDPLNPLYDRALRGLYPPGSTFKIVTTAAVLTENLFPVTETVYCGGSYRLGREVKRCWKLSGHGKMDLKNAFKHSCDVYFYEAGKRLGIETIAKYARSMGLGKTTGIGINREERGLVPDTAWKQRVYKQPWVGGETLSVAIGQGALQVTPLQMAVLTASVANGGILFRPRLALRSQDEEGNVYEQYPPEENGRIPLSVEHQKFIMDAMGLVVNEEGGTAYWGARSKKVEIGGKTGTAQVVGRHSQKKLEDHAWFVAVAPLEDPQIVVSVIVENAGHGSTAAAPLARSIIEAYLGDES